MGRAAGGVTAGRRGAGTIRGGRMRVPIVGGGRAGTLRVPIRGAGRRG